MREKALLMGFEPQGNGIFILDHTQRTKTVYNDNTGRLSTVVDGAVVDELVPETVEQFGNYVNRKGGQQ